MYKIDKTITYKTPSGKTVIVEHVIERQMISDHNYYEKCDEINVSVDGKALIGYNGISTRQLNGQTINVFQHLGSATYIAPEAMPEIMDMITAREERRSAKIKRENEFEKKYNQELSHICPKCGTVCYGDCEAN